MERTSENNAESNLKDSHPTKMIEMLQSKTFIAQYLTGTWHKKKTSRHNKEMN